MHGTSGPGRNSLLQGKSKLKLREGFRPGAIETEDHSWSSVLFFNPVLSSALPAPVSRLLTAMAKDHEFSTRADRFMSEVLEALDRIDPDDIDSQLAMGVLTMEFADGTKCIMNRQTAAHQIWLAHGATAWHFAYDEASGTWQDTKERGDLKSILEATLSEKLGRPVGL